MPLDPYHGIFTRESSGPRLLRHPAAPPTLPDPQTGRALRIETVEVCGAICPSCSQRGQGGFVSFVSDLRMVFACPHCHNLVWIDGA